MKHYLETSMDVIKECKSQKEGLSESEAEARLIQNGKNKLEKGTFVTHSFGGAYKTLCYAQRKHKRIIRHPNS